MAAVALIGLSGCRASAPQIARPTASIAEQTPSAASTLPTQAAEATPAPFMSGDADDPHILFINVGRADSALIAFRQKFWLVDTGTADSLPALVRALRLAGVETLEGVFLTHTHADHIGGLDGILKLFTVKNIYAAKITIFLNDGTNVVDDKAQATGRAVHRLSRGDKIPLGAGAEFTVLGPIVADATEDNNNSLVLRFQDGRFTCLFPGDMQFPEEDSLLSAGLITPCTVLKVADHGNHDASSGEFITAAAPKIAVISTDSTVDTNSPAPQVLANLINVGASIFVTQDAKTGILVTAHGGSATAQPYDAGAAPEAKDVRIESFSQKKDQLVLRNDGTQAVDLTHWWMASAAGGDMLFFPTGTILAPGGTLTVSGGKNMEVSDMLWPNKDAWSAKKNGAVSLYDRWGALVSAAQ